ncbi:TetR/AcrR family transcriptional regulator C-terminal domain-containing protein [Streptomyces sp. NPDC021749]|uniref:TetR/AcrR family transcriptional regulator C-terminal domain-containing protein n=1 Tax=Streptomyces sp. NPDC021749 TaxID=3154905 RepID=UPI0033CBB8FC
MGQLAGQEGEFRGRGGSKKQCDPELAAEHFLSLLTGAVEYRPDAEPDTVADTAVEVFLRAYGK